MLASLGTQTDKCIGRVASGMLAWKSSLAITEMQKPRFYCLGEVSFTILRKVTLETGRTQLHRSPEQLRVVPLVGIPTEIKVAPVQTFASLIALAFTLDRNIFPRMCKKSSSAFQEEQPVHIGAHQFRL